MNFAAIENPKTHSSSVIYGGTTVIGMKYKNGIIIAADTTLNYGSMSMIKNIQDKIQQLTKSSIIGYSGEYSDLQETQRMLRELILTDELNNTETLGPKEIANYVSNIHYAKRNKMKPFLNSIIMGGIDWDGKPVLYSIDPYGTLLEANYFSTSFGSYFCPAIISPRYPERYEDITKEECLGLLNKCFGVLYCRDANMTDSIKYVTIENNGKEIEYKEGHFKPQTEWNYDQYKNYANEKHYLIS